MTHYNISIALRDNHFTANASAAARTFRGKVRAQGKALARAHCLIFQTQGIEIQTLFVSIYNPTSQVDITNECICGDETLGGECINGPVCFKDTGVKCAIDKGAQFRVPLTAHRPGVIF